MKYTVCPLYSYCQILPGGFLAGSDRISSILLLIHEGTPLATLRVSQPGVAGKMIAISAEIENNDFIAFCLNTVRQKSIHNPLKDKAFRFFKRQG